jgi:hypothetical protein
MSQNIKHKTERRGGVVTTSASYSEGLGLFLGPETGYP